ncbi:hypothetical protein [Atopobium fossor]|uniref:hypothetical protein n=1 Tax=Atopobium fossor TaxID=39487 RepID=UPI00040FAD61|nr:hypothetical protein [Atopobium fossor]
MEQTNVQAFELGTPAIVCRWRLCESMLPLENRLLRALGKRQIDGVPVSRKLLAWAKQHLEWTLRSGSSDYPEGTLMVVIDKNGQAVMTVGPYEPLQSTSLAALIDRASISGIEAHKTCVAPETLWIVKNDVLYASVEQGTFMSGVASLVADLARTLGIPMVYDSDLVEKLSHKQIAFDQVFLCSDEHGIVAADGYDTGMAHKFVGSYQTLLEKERKKKRTH